MAQTPGYCVLLQPKGGVRTLTLEEKLLTIQCISHADLETKHFSITSLALQPSAIIVMELNNIPTLSLFCRKYLEASGDYA